MADNNFMHTAEIMKAAIPYVDARTKTTIEFVSKIFDLMNSYRSFTNPTDLAVCGFQNQSINIEGLLNGIRPLMKGKELEIVDRILNIFNMKKMFETYKTYMDMMKTMQEFGGFPFGGSNTTNSSTESTSNNFGFNFDSMFHKSETNSDNNSNNFNMSELASFLMSNMNNNQSNTHKENQKDENNGDFPSNSAVSEVNTNYDPSRAYSEFEEYLHNNSKTDINFEPSHQDYNSYSDIDANSDMDPMNDYYSNSNFIPEGEEEEYKFDYTQYSEDAKKFFEDVLSESKESGNEYTDYLSNMNMDSSMDFIQSFSQKTTNESPLNTNDIENQEKELFSNTLNSVDYENTYPSSNNEDKENVSNNTKETPNPTNKTNMNPNMMIEMLKTMVPPEQKNTFENLSMLFKTMSYDNNSKKD